MMKNYLSLWIGNFGVVPLLLLAAFLLAPAFLAFSLLLALVCCVFDAISKTFVSLNNLKNRFLSFNALTVKVFILCLTLDAYSNENTSLYLSKGQQIEHEIDNLSHFSIGNPEVISIKRHPKKKSLLIKAKKMGFSDLMYWDQKQRKYQLSLFVLSKRHQQKQVELMESLSSKDIKINKEGSALRLSGKINNLADYLLIHRLKNSNKSLIIQNTLTRKLKNKLIAHVYKQLLNPSKNILSCQSHNIQILCTTSGSVDWDKMQKLTTNYYIQFKNKEVSKLANYKIEFKIIQINHTNLENHSLGLYQAESDLQATKNDLFNLVNKNQVVALNENSHAKLIANPTSSVVLGEKFKVQIGAQIPFRVNSINATNINWQFAGIQIESIITQQHNRLLIDFKTQVSEPNGEAIVGTKAQAKLFIKTDQSNELIHIELENKGNTLKQLPIINKIPILNSIFSKNTNQFSKQDLLILAKVTKESF